MLSQTPISAERGYQKNPEKMLHGGRLEEIEARIAENLDQRIGPFQRLETLIAGLKLGAEAEGEVWTMFFHSRFGKINDFVSKKMKELGASDSFIQNTVHHLNIIPRPTAVQREKLDMIRGLLQNTGASTKFQISTLKRCFDDLGALDKVLANLQSQTGIYVGQSSENIQ